MSLLYIMTDINIGQFVKPDIFTGKLNELNDKLPGMSEDFKQSYFFYQKNSQNNEYQQMNEYINAKYGVSRYASNQVSGKMFKKI